MIQCTLERRGYLTREVKHTDQGETYEPWKAHESINAAKRASRAHQKAHGGLGMGSVRVNHNDRKGKSRE